MKKEEKLTEIAEWMSSIFFCNLKNFSPTPLKKTQPHTQRKIWKKSEWDTFSSVIYSEGEQIVTCVELGKWEESDKLNKLQTEHSNLKKK